MEITYDYLFEIHLGSSLNSVLVFSAYVSKDERDKYYIQPHPDLGIDENFKDIFIRALEGRLVINYINQEKFLNGEIEEQSLRLDNMNHIENLKKFTTISQEYYGFTSELKTATFMEIFKFRFDGAYYDLKYGVPFVEAGKIDEFSNEFVKIATAKNENFKGMLQYEKIASSTSIPYIGTSYDNEIITIIRQLLENIIAQRLDSVLLREDSKKGKIYKKLLEQMFELSKIKDLDIFEIYLLNETSPMISIDEHQIDAIRSLRDQMYREEVTKEGIVRYHFPLKQKNVCSLVLDVEGIDLNFHYLKTDEINNKVNRICIEGKKVQYRALRKREETYDLLHIELAPE